MAVARVSLSSSCARLDSRGRVSPHGSCYGRTFHMPNGHSSQTGLPGVWRILRMNAELLGRTVQEFLSEAAEAVVLEDGAVAFDLTQARYSISGEHNKCLLHLWSAERNTVRRVLEAEVKNGMLRLAVQRLGQARP